MSQVNQETAQKISEENAARAVVYNFISSLFAKELTSDLVAKLTSAQGQDFLNSLALEPSLTASIEGIKVKLAKLSSEESLLELAADFCGLFLVDGRASVSPYAGQYLSAKKSTEPSVDTGSKRKKDKIQIFGELHQQMTEFLTDNKLQIHCDFPEPGDHIAVILAYIAHLCITAEPKEQGHFIKCYLMTWLSDFTQQVNEHDHGLFYGHVADLTLEWLKVDSEFLPND